MPACARAGRPSGSPCRTGAAATRSSGTGHIQINGVDPASVSTAAATQGGQAGTLLPYGTAGDSVFLAGVGALNDGDVVYAGMPPSAPGDSGGEQPSPPAADAADWGVLAAGQWFV
jgi:hypothetical protein